MFFTYHQNAVKGCFQGPEAVCIEAGSAREADAVAEKHGVYFDGVDKEIDCQCCGDRWFRQTAPGTQSPEFYGDSQAKWSTRGRSSKVIYLDGEIIEVS